MPVITLKFAKDLDEHKDFQRHFGARFHRWLPDGEKDAIIIQSKYSNAKVKLWFQRLGYVSNGMIEYDAKRKEVDHAIMTKQGLLESGPLHGKIESLEITDEELRVLEEKRIGDKAYQDLGKRIAKIIDPILIKFFYILRIHFGQYWLPDFEKYDSVKGSIGHHLRFLWITWSKNDDHPWEEFTPDNEHPTVDVSFSDYKSFFDLIKESDWRNLQDLMKEDHEKSLAAVTLARTHQYLVEGDIRRAFVEGVTALELAIEEFMKTKLEDNVLLKDNVQGFWNLSISAQLISVAVTLGILKDDIENTITSIKWRNRIVHYGWEPEFYPSRKNLFSLLRTTAILLNGPMFKFPDAGGNAILSQESWDKAQK